MAKSKPSSNGILGRPYLPWVAWLADAMDSWYKIPIADLLAEMDADWTRRKAGECNEPGWPCVFPSQSRVDLFRVYISQLRNLFCNQPIIQSDSFSHGLILARHSIKWRQLGKGDLHSKFTLTVKWIDQLTLHRETPWTVSLSKGPESPSSSPSHANDIQQCRRKE